MTKISTLVFIDLETTGLPQDEHNKTKIVELSMVAVDREHFLMTRAGATPRVQDKLTLCFSPRKMIYPDSTKNTGLDNELLEHKTPFNADACDIIIKFLNFQCKPVCLIAQNGMGFDFPILKNHLAKFNVTFDENIVCADCFHAFYDILEAKKKDDEIMNLTIPKNSECNCIPVTETQDSGKEAHEVNKELSHNSENSISRENESLMRENRETVTLQHRSETIADLSLNNDIIIKEEVDFQAMNNSTPKRPITSKHPEKPTKQISRLNKARRRFPWSQKRPKDSYKLKNVYERVLNKPAPDPHRAENDCIYALEVAVALGERFVLWIDENCCLFSDIKPMTPGVRLGF